MSFFVYDADHTCMKLELTSDIGEFLNPSLKSEIYEKLNDSFNGRPLYYNKESRRHVYATHKGFWVVINFKTRYAVLYCNI